MVVPTRAERIMVKAAQQAPAAMKKKRERKSFKAYTVTQLLETYRDPRAVLLEIASMDTMKLAKLIAMDGQKTGAINEDGTEELYQVLPHHMLDALGERRLAATVVLPYVAQRLPVQVDMRHTKAIHLNIVDDRQYQELVDISTEPVTPEDGMSLQLIGSAIAEESDEQSADAQGEQMPVTPTVPLQRKSARITGK